MRRESDPATVVAYVVAAMAAAIVILLVVITLIFLSSTRAEASRGPSGIIVYDCCRAVNPKSGTSYRTVALAFQSNARSVFERGTEAVEYVLQWPHLPSVAEQLIKVAQERLSLLMVAAADEKAAPQRHRALVERRRLSVAVGMACFFGGLMLAISLWPYRKD